MTIPNSNHFQLTLDHLKSAPLPSMAATHGKTVLQVITASCSAYIVFTDATWIEFYGYDSLTTGYTDQLMIQNRQLPAAMLQQQLIDSQTHAEWAAYHRAEDQAERQRYLSRLREELAEAEAVANNATEASA